MATPSETLVVDNFLDDPDAYREAALKRDYYTVKGQADGGEYRCISVVKTTEHKEKIESAIGRKIDPDYAFCRYGLYGSSLNNLIHADSGISPYACVVYLNPADTIPEGSGTAFYLHKKLKLEKVPTVEEVRAAGKSPKRVWETLDSSWNDADAWREVSRVDMKYNRAIFFETDRFHSRLPLDGFGTDMATARLIFVSFFKVL